MKLEMSRTTGVDTDYGTFAEKLQKAADYILSKHQQELEIQGICFQIHPPPK